MAFEKSKHVAQAAGTNARFVAPRGAAQDRRQERRDTSVMADPDRAPQTDPKTHIVDQLIAERGGSISDSFIWPLVRPALHKFLHYREAVRMADQIADLPAQEAMHVASDRLQLDVRTTGLENVPKTGSFIIVCNHPTGIADGVAMWDALAKRRPDMTVFANRDAIRVSRKLSDIIIPVEWREGFKTRDKSRETLRLTSAAIKAGRPIVIFPSGRIAYWANGGLNEREWQRSALTLARKYNLTVVPANMQSRNSGLFYWFAKWSRELRDMTVFHELLNKQGTRFDITFGQPIDPETLETEGSGITDLLQDFCFDELAKNPDAVFDPRGKLASQGQAARA
ncbi:MAG: 1-acyl-sn-glycerol-3-phosphate acyltransferase [Pseudomonadota bacterium]